MALRTKAIKSPRESKDGLRVSVMSRHTLDDGITPDPDIVEGISYGAWWPELAPPPHLVGSWYKRRLSWEDFEWKFLRHLNDPASYAKLLELVELSRRLDVTILCVEETPEHCHRRLIAEACLRIDPSLEVIIK